MPNQLAKLTNYIQKNKKKVLINTGLVLVIAALASGPFWYKEQLKKQYYEPTKACDMLTVNQAADILKTERVIKVEKNEPILSHDNSLATSKCAFTDSNPDTAKMKLVAVAVQSAIDDAGVAKNKTDFETLSQEADMVRVDNLGKNAFYNTKEGQLNILQDKRWVMISYGLANAPEATEVETVKSIAQDLL